MNNGRPGDKHISYQKIKTVHPIRFTTDSINGIIIIVAIRWIGIENLGQERDWY